jgi:hypothetical protein
MKKFPWQLRVFIALIWSGLIGLTGLLGLALAQQTGGYFIASPTGLEQINVTTPTGNASNPYNQWVYLNQIRNSTGLQLVGTGTTVNTAVPNTTGTLLASGAITTWNVTFPTAPYDGESLKEGCPGGNVGTLTNSATLPTGVTIVGASFSGCTESSATDAQWHYNLANNAWYRSE